MPKTRENVRILLVQVRKDPVMLRHEEACFRRSGGLDGERLATRDLLSGPMDAADLDGFDGMIVGGSGDFSVLDDVPNLGSLKETLRAARARKFPTLGACFGAQLIAESFGGAVVRDPARQEVGTYLMAKTDAAAGDPVFGGLPQTFMAQAGHNDRVDVLPDGAVLLARSELCPVQAFAFPADRMYAVQFHPELSREDLLMRLEHYKENYVTEAASVDAIIARLEDTPVSAGLVGRWIDAAVVPATL